MKNLLKKIIWRVKSLIKSIYPIFLALVFEPTKHPWEYIFNYILLDSNRRYKKSHYYLNKYFKIIKQDNNKIFIDFDDIKIILETLFYKNSNNLVSLLILYYDLIYPTKVKFPIPIIFEEGPYELKNFKISSGDFVIDCGANIGFFTFIASNVVENNGKVFAFEPIKEAYDILKNSKNYNKYSKNINLITKAVGSNNNNLTFKVSEENLGGSTKNSQGNRIIEQTTIDEFVKNNKIEKINFIKMDIEGMEVDAIKGATNTIKRFKPKLALCIYHNADDLKNLKQIIKSTRGDYKFYNTDYKLYAW